jgi:hypothetical protein
LQKDNNELEKKIMQVKDQFKGEKNELKKKS